MRLHRRGVEGRRGGFELLRAQDAGGHPQRGPEADPRHGPAGRAVRLQASSVRPDRRPPPVWMLRPGR